MSLQPPDAVLPRQATIDKRVVIHDVGDIVNHYPLSDAEDAAAEVIAALADDTSPADQAVLNADIAAWLATLDERRATVARQLASGLNTVDVSKLHGVTRAMIYLIRKDLIAAWERFHGTV